MGNFLWGNLWVSAPGIRRRLSRVSRLPPVFSNREGSAVLVAGTGGGFEDLQIQISQEVLRRCTAPRAYLVTLKRRTHVRG